MLSLSFYTIYLVFSPQAGLAGTRAHSGDRHGSGTLHLEQVLRGRLPFLSPAFRRPHLLRQVPPRLTTRETSSSGRWNSSFRQIWPRRRLPRNSRDLLHAANLRHGADGFTSPLKEGVLKIFLPLKIRRLRPGLNPRTWVPKASTLPLEHRSRFFIL